MNPTVVPLLGVWCILLQATLGLGGWALWTKEARIRRQASWALGIFLIYDLLLLLCAFAFGWFAS